MIYIVHRVAGLCHPKPCSMSMTLEGSPYSRAFLPSRDSSLGDPSLRSG